MASQTTLATERAKAGRDDGGPIAALAAVAVGDAGSPQDPAADAAARAAKPPEAGGDGVRSKGRIFTPDGKLVYVNIYSPDSDAAQHGPPSFPTVSVMPRLSRRIKGMGIVKTLGRPFAVRARLNPDRMRAPTLSSEDVKKALTPSTAIGSPDQPA